MTTIQELNKLGIKDLTELCYTHAVGVSIGKDQTIQGIVPMIEVRRK